MNKTLSMFTYLPVATLFISACSTMRAGEYTAGWSENQTPEVIKLSNGFSLRYLRGGRGRPLVLLHTIRTQLDYFEQLVPALKSQYQVYVLDLPGHGQSSLSTTEYTEELLRKSVTEFIQQLNLRDVTLVGESIGGVLALTVSAELPDRVVRGAVAGAVGQARRCVDAVCTQEELSYSVSLGDPISFSLTSFNLYV
jgi:pimeloyl-ACP methyl ester carboxylesterase